ncbi:MAG: hypothetical protein MUQ26_07375, partial [Armatimonadetes bacterium]|nr:hypothetical protein [Armatimonadota bacterium]
MTSSVATEAASDRTAGVTWRAVLIAFLLLILLIPVAFYVEMAWNKAAIFVGIPAMGPIVVLFLLAAAMSIPLLRRHGLTRRELLVIYSILLVAGPVVSHSILGWMLVKTIAYYYMARANVIWQTTFLDQVPTWLAPTDPAAAEAFFEGRAPVPWHLWWGPLGAWSFFTICLFIASLSVIAILQRQWVTNERLSFPIAQ